MLAAAMPSTRLSETSGDGSDQGLVLNNCHIDSIVYITVSDLSTAETLVSGIRRAWKDPSPRRRSSISRPRVLPPSPAMNRMFGNRSRPRHRDVLPNRSDASPYSGASRYGQRNSPPLLRNPWHPKYPSLRSPSPYWTRYRRPLKPVETVVATRLSEDSIPILNYDSEQSSDTFRSIEKMKKELRQIKTRIARAENDAQRDNWVCEDQHTELSDIESDIDCLQAQARSRPRWYSNTVRDDAVRRAWEAQRSDPHPIRAFPAVQERAGQHPPEELRAKVPPVAADLPQEGRQVVPPDQQEQVCKPTYENNQEEGGVRLGREWEKRSFDHGLQLTDASASGEAPAEESEAEVSLSARG
ncbi:hypothetical protein VTI74DRAFT_10487 [Chaetomium olivicolor]